MRGSGAQVHKRLLLMRCSSALRVTVDGSHVCSGASRKASNLLPRVAAVTEEDEAALHDDGVMLCSSRLEITLVIRSCPPTWISS